MSAYSGGNNKMIRLILILIVLLIAAFLVYIYSGIYNIGASTPHSEAVTWVFNTTKKYSVRKHAEDIQQADIYDERLVEAGFEHYDDMCSGCHGSPGEEPAKIFNPSPPALAESRTGFNPSELFWIVKNGIKMTGMPEFGSLHSDEDIWAITAFLVKLPDMTRKQYAAMKEKSGTGHDEHSHDHDE
jgi:mono/diheme cytochrome c family protein